jgi:peroxiredoxin Q/BCP
MAESRGVAVFGVNPAGAAKHCQFRAKHRFPFPLLVDQARKIASRYRANGLIIRRTVYLIGPDGAIRFAQRGMPPPADVLAKS